MKIQVVIEATSIQEYTEAIQALAAGYTVASPALTAEVVIPKESVKTVYAEAKQAVEQDTVKADKPVKEVEKPKDTATPKTEEKTADEPTSSDEQQGPIHGFPAVKLIASKLSKITDGKSEVKALLAHYSVTKLSELSESQYDDFHADATQIIADHDNVKSNESVEDSTKEDKPAKEESSEEVTLEMIRSKAKELSVAGYKEEIKAALKEIGAPALTKIPKDKYASFYETMGNIQ